MSCMSTWSHLILRFVFSQLNATFWAGMSGFLHVIHAEGDKAARPTSNEAKNHCNQELQIKDLEIPNSEKGTEWTIYRCQSRFFVQVGHQTTHASSRYHHFFYYIMSSLDLPKLLRASAKIAKFQSQFLATKIHRIFLNFFL